MNAFQPCIVLILISQLTLSTSWARDIDAIVADLDHNDFKVRNAAIAELKQKKLSGKALKKLITNSKSPETRTRLEFLRRQTQQFIPFTTGDPIPHGITAQGAEADGSPLFLVRVRHKGKIYAGKYSTRFSVAYIPLGDKEVEVLTKAHLTQVELFTGKAKWNHHKKSKNPLVVGHIKTANNKTPKIIYAVRAKIEGGTHLGMLIEGEKQGRFPYGKKTLRLNNYHILQK